MLFLLRLNVSKKSESSPSANGGTYRPTSPRETGSSILITSAPRSASCSVPHGPAPNCSNAITRMSASGSTDDLGEKLDLIAEAGRVDGRMEDDVLGARRDVLGDALCALRVRPYDAVPLNRTRRELRPVAVREGDPRLLGRAADERGKNDGGSPLAPDARE